jgi:serine/threonine protein kinase/tetratricopeptide (TPR) repeat protein
MKRDMWREIEEIYHAAVDREPLEREIFLKTACAGNEELQREVTLLLESDNRAKNFLKNPVLEVAAQQLASETQPVFTRERQVAEEPFESLEPGRLVRHFRLLRRIGQGGMGQVYLAEDLKLGRSVAVKFLPTATLRNDSARLRFLREARAASSLNHPNIVTIHAIEEADGVDFIVMEFVEGETLSSRIARGPIELPHLLDLGWQVADAIRAAHEIGIIHRDIKPANILITPQGPAKVLDFGLAKRVQPVGSEGGATDLSGDLTGAGLIVGTVAYMSPEQTRGEQLDGRSDIFSLGVVLYEAATGRGPFSGPSILSIMHQIATSQAPSPSAFVSELPREFDLIIERALAKDRNQRFSSAAEMAEALNRLRQISGAVQPGIAPAMATEASQTSLVVGREPELNRLNELLQQAAAGSGRVVFITGEPGIGKTSLADAFLRRARNGQPSLIVSRGRCVEQYGTGEAYLPFLDALGALLMGPGRERIATVLRTYAPTWCLQFPGSFCSSGAMEELQRETIGATKERMLRELADALGALAANLPILLLLEDLHWADPSSVDLLRHVCQRIGGQRMLVVATFRPEDVEVSNHPLKNYRVEMKSHKLCEEIALQSLSEAHIAAYLDARFPDNDFPRELATLLVRKTEGHPLFATSLVEFLAERGDIARTETGWSLTSPLAGLDLEAPESVRSMIRRKIEALDEDDRRALQYASVEGEEFLSTVVAHLLGVDDLTLEERFDRLARLHRLVEPLGEEELPDGSLATRYRFSHALYQNVLYGLMINKRRMLLHQQAGDLLKQHYSNHSSRIAAQLAMHFERGRDYGQAIEYLLQAGNNAIKLFASEEAERHYSRALELVEKLPADAQAGPSLRIYEQRGAVSMYISHFPQAVDDYTHMLDRARQMRDIDQESIALIGLSHALYWSHRLDEMAVRVDETVRAVEQSGSEPLRLEMLSLIGAKHNCYGELTESKPLLDEIIRGARAIDHRPALLNGLVWRGQLYFFQSEYVLAEEVLTESREVSEELRNGFHLLHSLFFLGLLRANMGRMSEALKTLNEATEMAARNGDHFWVSRLPNCIGFIHHELQDFGGALEYNRKGLEVARRDRVLEAESNSLINLGSVCLNTGQSYETLPAFHNVEEIFGRDAWFRWRYNIRLQAGKAQYWLAQGDLDQAQSYSRKLLEMASRYDAGKYIASGHKLQADIALASGDLATAEAELLRALELLSERPVPVLAWKTYAALGRLKGRTNDVAASGDAFARAGEIVDLIASHVHDDSLKAIFLNSAAVREVRSGIAPSR